MRKPTFNQNIKTKSEGDCYYMDSLASIASYNSFSEYLAAATLQRLGLKQSEYPFLKVDTSTGRAQLLIYSNPTTGAFTLRSGEAGILSIVSV